MLKSFKQTLMGGGLAAVIICAGTISAQAAMDGDTRNRLAEVLGGDHRPAEQVARDSFRNPAETLEFFGLQKDMTVVEVWPGGGWYTNILAPVLADSGTYVAGHWDPEANERIAGAIERFKERTSDEDLYGEVTVGVLTADRVAGMPDGDADMVLTFRNIHNWMGTEGAAEKMFEHMYAALKPGGHLGVVEHRGNPNIAQDPKARSGYVNEGYAIKLAQDAGFEFVAASDVNDNPRDDKDYEKRVWRLPPTLRHFGGPNDGELTAEDRAKNLEIGESDRYTLLFVKPTS